MQADYKTYWSILDSPAVTVQSSSIALCMAICASVLWVLVKKYKKDRGEGDRSVLLWSTGAFAVLGFSAYISLTFFYPDNSREETIKMLNSKEALKVEGVISGFERTIRHTRYANETIEMFTVDSVRFAYGDALLGKFNSFTHTNNDVIFNGQRVRITYVQRTTYCHDCNAILKLEIAQ